MSFLEIHLKIWKGKVGTIGSLIKEKWLSNYLRKTLEAPVN